MFRILVTLFFAAVLGTSGLRAQTSRSQDQGPSTAPSSAEFPKIPAGRDEDLKLYRADGSIEKGAGALEKMHADAQLILWLAGNQFFAMDDVIRSFQNQNRNVAVGLITLPPGLLLNAIQKGGWKYAGREFPGRPDIYASVNIGHLKALKQAGLMDSYRVYMHNELVLLVADGNPKNIEGIRDLVRPDVRTSLPNPVNEGIMQFYGRKVLERHGLWSQIANGHECVACQTTPNNWFTAVHHRETPDRILAGSSDTGIVWKTEAMQADRAGLKLGSIKLPPEDSMRDEVSYAVGILNTSAHKDFAAKYLDFLASPEGQEIYTRFGFVRGTPEELRLRPIP